MDKIEMQYTHFLCPISMQLMKDPVIVSSGITYDRESVEKWLYCYNNITCPVTKQDLSGTDLTPNHTLRRFIQAWCIINSGNGIDRIPTPKPPVSKIQILKLFEESKKSSKIQLNCMHKLKCIAQESRSNKKCIVNAGGVEFLASILLKKNVADTDTDTNTKNARVEALYILCHLELSDVDLKKLMEEGGILFMESLLQILKGGDFESRVYAITLMRSIYSVVDPMGFNPEFFIQIVHILSNHISQQATKATLKLLLELCQWGKNRIKAANAGVVSVLIERLLDTSDKRVSELILAGLDQLCKCVEGRGELIKHEAGLAVVSKRIFRVSHLASEKAVGILCSISKYSGNPRVIQEMLNVGVVAKLCLVLQVESNGKMGERTREILRLYSRVWKDSPCIPKNLLYYYPS